MLILVPLPAGTMQKGLSVREELLALLMAVADFEMTDVLEMLVGMEAAGGKKDVRIWKVISFSTVFSPSVFMIFFDDFLCMENQILDEDLPGIKCKS